MSEYWKSTPKFWCKHCKIYIRDSPLERSQHEASPRHQGNLKRFLGELHKDHQRDEREQQRAKAEVARLNGTVSSGGSSSRAAPPLKPILDPAARAARAAREREVRGPATIDDRKKQMEQLASLGVAIPDEFKAELAMPSGWVTTNITMLDESGAEVITAPKERVQDDDADEKGGANVDYRSGFKRKRMGDVEEEDVVEANKKKGWGKTFKEYPGNEVGGDDLDELFSRAKKAAVRQDDSITFVAGNADQPEDEVEEVTAEVSTVEADTASTNDAVVFKKRKAKAIRQK